MAGLNHSKPFGAQTPEQIAKDYGGNKAKIAQAMQLGIVDPTVGTLAGMFIDRMAAGAQQSQAPQGTVASQVFNPQTPPAQAPGGLPAISGAPPMGAGAPPPDMPMPPQSPQDMQPMGPGMAEGGMVAFAGGGHLHSLLPFPEAGLPESTGFADGGLATLPVPDDMFNSSVGDNDTQNYAPGGVVAFAEGGPLGPWFEKEAVEAIPGIRVTSRERSAADNAQVGGNPHSYHLTNNARDFAPPTGMGMGALKAQLTNLYGPGYDIINEGDHVHVEPGGHRGARTATGIVDPMDAFNPANLEKTKASLTALAPQQHTYSDMAMEETRRVLADEKKDRKQAANMALMNFGLALMSSKSPNFLTAVGEAGAPAVAGLKADLKDLKKEARDAIMEAAKLEDYSNKEGRELAHDALAHADKLAEIAVQNRALVNRSASLVSKRQTR